MTRKQILAKIDDLHDNNCKSCPHQNSENAKYCSECPVFAELNNLGMALSKPKQDKLDTLVNKGKDLTYTEYKYLINQGVSKTKIRRKMNISTYELDNFIKNNNKGEIKQ